MNKEFFLTQLDQLHSSYLVLYSLGGLAIVAGILFQSGLIGWLLRIVGQLVRRSIRNGFILWERLFAWASWPLFLTLVLGVLALGWVAAGHLPGSGERRLGSPPFFVDACLFLGLHR